jgi:drug/metabolite transporter (DMT)-like permease
MIPQRETRGVLALLAGATCIGFAPLWVRWSEVGPAATALHRLVLALPCLFLWAARERHSTPHGLTRRDLVWVVAAGAWFAVDLAAWHLSIRFTTVANATLLGNFAPIFVTLGAWILLGERAGGSFFAGMLLAFLGAWGLTGATVTSDSQRLRGDALGLATAVFYGAYQLCVARLRRSHGPGRILLGSSLVSIPLLGLIAWASGEVILPGSLRGWAVLLGLALTAQVLGQGLITVGFAHLPAGYASLMLLLQPVVATLAGWIVLGERLGPRETLGGALLLTGLAIARRRPERTEPGKGRTSAG